MPMNPSASSKAFFGLLASVITATTVVAQTTYTYAPPSTPANWNAPATWGLESGFPNGEGVAIVKNSGGSSSTLAQNVEGGVTIGSVELSGSTANTWTINPTNGITFDGFGASSAQITLNSNNTGARIVFGAGTITLNSDLVVTNLSYSNTSTAGSILFQSVIAGTNRNITFSNASNTMNAGNIRMESNNSTFTGSVTVAKGIVSYTTASSLGSASNTITLGSVGGGGASLVSNRANTTAVNLANNITVVAGSGGALMLGAAPTVASGSTTTTYSGAITLNGNLTTWNENTSTGESLLVFSGPISGSGGIEVTGSDPTQFTGVNTYTGSTSVAAGSALSLTSTSELRFNLQNGSISNQVSGAGSVVFDGLFRLNVAGLSGMSDTWTLVNVGTLSESFGSNFNLAFVGGPTFANVGGGLYTSGDWSFSTATGVLTFTSTVIPEPETWAAFSIAMLGLIVWRRRRSQVVLA